VVQVVVELDQKLQAQRQQELKTLAVVVAVAEHPVLVVDQVVLVVKE
jgi:putative hemolysin